MNFLNNLISIPVYCHQTRRTPTADELISTQAKAFLRGEFQKWYSDQTMQQLDNPTTDFSTAEFNPVDLSMAAIKEITGQWLVKVYDWISNNPDFI